MLSWIVGIVCRLLSWIGGIACHMLSWIVGIACPMLSWMVGLACPISNTFRQFVRSVKCSAGEEAELVSHHLVICQHFSLSLLSWPSFCRNISTFDMFDV